MAPVPISFFSGINFKKAGGYTSFYLLSSLFDCALLSAQDAPPKNIELPEVQIILPPETVAKPKADSSQQNSASAQVAQADKAASGKVDQAKTETAVEQPKVKPGDSVQGMPGTGTTGINGYVASGTSTATKTNTPILDIPQSITIITKKEAEDRGSQTLGEVLRYVPGITVAQGEGHRDQITIRGQNTTASFFVDGVRDDVEYFRDLYNVDVIEVLKGPDAMIFGRGGGGGIVNRVTKKANGERIREATVTSGSYNRARTTVDVGDKISPDAAFRFNTMYEYSESFRDYFDLQRYGFNPTLAFRPNDNTKISLSYEYFKDDRVVDRGVPSFIGTPGRPSNGPIEDFFGNPNVSQSDFEGQSATATLEHRTESGVNIRNHTFLATYDKVYSNTFANSPVTFPGSCGDLSGCVTLGGYKNGTQRDTAVNQTDVTYLWDMGNGIRHTFLGGAEFSYQETENYRNNASFGLPGTLSFVVPFDHPTTFVPVFYDQFQRDWNTEVSTYSAYIQDQLEITKYFELIGGIRYERFDVAFDGRTAGVNGGNPQSISRIDNVFPYRVGAVFKPIETTSFYITTADSFLPGAGDQFGNLTVINGQTLEPEEFKNKEFGFKWEVAPRLLFTGALYQLDRSNQIVPTSPTTSAQLGLTRTRGGELALTGYITDQWQVSAGWGHQIATIIESGTNPFEGNNVPFVPHNLVSMWNRYQFLSWFGSGLGIIYQDSSFAEPNNAVELPAFTRVDAALYFDFNENWRAQVNVENILDEKYYASAHNNNNISPGAPRQAFVTLRAKF